MLAKRDNYMPNKSKSTDPHSLDGLIINVGNKSYKRQEQEGIIDKIVSEREPGKVARDPFEALVTMAFDSTRGIALTSALDALVPIIRTVDLPDFATVETFSRTFDAKTGSMG
jgi:hypothetical protein